MIIKRKHVRFSSRYETSKYKVKVHVIGVSQSSTNAFRITCYVFLSYYELFFFAFLINSKSGTLQPSSTMYIRWAVIYTFHTSKVRKYKQNTWAFVSNKSFNIQLCLLISSWHKVNSALSKFNEAFHTSSHILAANIFLEIQLSILISSGDKKRPM